MKKLIKIAALILAVAMLATCFVGCGKKEEADTVVFGTNAEFPPFEFVNAKGGIYENFDGIDMAIVKQIEEDNGIKAKISNMEFDSLLIAIQNGQIDACISGMTITEERKEEVDFSIPYYSATQVMIVKEDSGIESAKDLKDKKILVIQGYTGEICVKDMGYKYEAFKKGPEAVLEVVNGKADCFVVDSATAAEYIGDNEGLKIVKDEEAFEVEEYGIAVKKGNTELLNKINATIQKMLDDGTIGKLSAQYSEAE